MFQLFTTIITQSICTEKVNCYYLPANAKQE